MFPQSPDSTPRAKIDHVARELGRRRPADERDGLGILAAADQAELHDPGDLLAETHAARALDAAAHLLRRHQRAELLSQDHPLLFLVARVTVAVADGEVLQLAFAALVADWTVERVVDEQELHHPVLCLFGVELVCTDPHAL